MSVRVRRGVSGARSPEVSGTLFDILGAFSGHSRARTRTPPAQRARKTPVASGPRGSQGSSQGCSAWPWCNFPRRKSTSRRGRACIDCGELGLQSREPTTTVFRTLGAECPGERPRRGVQGSVTRSVQGPLWPRAPECAQKSALRASLENFGNNSLPWTPSFFGNTPGNIPRVSTAWCTLPCP